MLMVAGRISKTILAVLQVRQVLFPVLQHGVIKELLLIKSASSLVDWQVNQYS
jgi:hypothetical protein